MERKALEGCKAMVDLQLCDDNNSIKDEVMLVQVMTVDIPQSRPISESTINSFMSSTTFLVFQSEVIAQIRKEFVNNRQVTTIATIGPHLLSWKQTSLQSDSVDGLVIAASSREGAMDPNNVASVDADSDFVSDTRLSVLVV